MPSQLCTSLFWAQVRQAIEAARRDADATVALELQRIKAQEAMALEQARYAKDAAEFDNEKAGQVPCARECDVSAGS